MKEYERHVIWLDYFNSELKRSEGRRVPLSSSTRAPTIEELSEACRRLNLKPMTQPAKYPSSPSRQSGYVSVMKSGPKHKEVQGIAKELSVVRGMALKKQSAGRPGRKKQERAAKV
jgi:signal recognition particle subunit SRP19